LGRKNAQNLSPTWLNIAPKMARDIPKKGLVWPPSGFHGGLCLRFEGFAGPKIDQNLSPTRRAQIFGIFLPENGFQRPPWNFIQRLTTPEKA